MKAVVRVCRKGRTGTTALAVSLATEACGRPLGGRVGPRLPRRAPVRGAICATKTRRRPGCVSGAGSAAASAVNPKARQATPGSSPDTRCASAKVTAAGREGLEGFFAVILGAKTPGSVPVHQPLVLLGEAKLT